MTVEGIVEPSRGGRRREGSERVGVLFKSHKKADASDSFLIPLATNQLASTFFFPFKQEWWQKETRKSVGIGQGLTLMGAKQEKENREGKRITNIARRSNDEITE